MPLLVAAAIFVSILLLVMGLYYLYDQAAYGDPTAAGRRMRMSMDAEARAAAIDIVRRDAMQQDEWYVALINRFAPLGSIKRLLRQADSDMPVSVFLLMTTVCATAGLVIAFYLRLAPLFILAGAAVGGALPYRFQARKRRKRLKAVEIQLPDALDLIARTLMAGHAFIMGLKMVSEQLEDPIRSEFRKAFDEISFGVGVAEAMKDLSERVDLIDVKFFVTSLLVQLETGGNLAEIIQGIAGLIRARFELYGKIQTLSAEGRISALVMFVLPFGLGGALFLINPSYMSLLVTDPAGQSMLKGGFFMMLLGLYVTRRMIQIKV
ncbi:MAG TPA: type II secretion system F family protein [Candidatus Binatia bacterium]|jgi:tight adherence protein B